MKKIASIFHHQSSRQSTKQSPQAQIPQATKPQPTQPQVMAQQSLKGKVAIVTGAAKINGIGAAAAIEFAKQGANVGFLPSQGFLFSS